VTVQQVSRDRLVEYIGELVKYNDPAIAVRNDQGVSMVKVASLLDHYDLSLLDDSEDLVDVHEAECRQAIPYAPMWLISTPDHKFEYICAHAPPHITIVGV
jgi:hypothetical protein